MGSSSVSVPKNLLVVEEPLDDSDKDKDYVAESTITDEDKWLEKSKIQKKVRAVNKKRTVMEHSPLTKIDGNLLFKKKKEEER